MLPLKVLIFAAMLNMNPLYKHSFEDPIVRSERYNSIASDIAYIAMDQKEEPLFTGPDGRIKTAIFLASVANNESDFSQAIDSGKKFGDHGWSACIFQIGVHQKEPNNYSRKYLLSDRKNCIRAGLHMIRLHRCAGWIGSMMRSYVSGSCKKRKIPEHERMISYSSWGEVSGYIFVINKLKNIDFIYKNIEGYEL